MSSTPRDEARLLVNSRKPRVFDPPRLPDGRRSPVSDWMFRQISRQLALE